MSQQFIDLAELTDAVYRSRLSGMQKMLQHEARLRQNLQRLEQMGSGDETPEQHAMAMRAIGADLLWQGWMARRKTELNIQLANLLAQKSAISRDLALAFGRAQVAEALVERERDHAATVRRRPGWDD